LLAVLDSKALTKIQSITLIAIILIATIGGGVAYVLWNASQPPPEDIRVGICADLDGGFENMWQGAVLAAEQINAQGGLLGRNVTIVAEDDDLGTSLDIAVGVNALTRLITVDKADYVITFGGVNALAYQDLCCEHKKIMIGVGVGVDEYSQRVLDNYDKYKYSFQTYALNNTIQGALMLSEIIAVGKYTGFTKVALLFDDFPVGKGIAASLSRSLPDYGFEVVYNSSYSFGAFDFTSYLAAIEASGAEIVVPYIITQGNVAFVKEWYDRQSPFVVWGFLGSAAMPGGWGSTEGKCDTVSCVVSPVATGYPLTAKTVPFREAYIQRWEDVPDLMAGVAYDSLRFILADAIERAGTTETMAVVKAMETTDVETSSARHFVFTSSHDVMVEFESPTEPSEEYSLNYYFQWQNGTQVPVYPESIMKEAEATYKYPPWPGPWSSKQTP